MTDLPGLLPRPSQVQRLSGELLLEDEVTIAYPDAAAGAGATWAGWLAALVGRPPRRVGDGATVELFLGSTPPPGIPAMVAPRRGPEAYGLRVGQDGLDAFAESPAGLSNALQTARQLVPAAALRPAGHGRARARLPAVVVSDAPLLAWRGAHLDVARHMMPAAWLFGFVDVLALHKLNVLHLHLTDDQGWRFPVPGWPRLEQEASWRAETLVGHARDPHPPRGAARFDGTPHGGCYDAATLASLAAFAAERNVTVVPEVDLPGHVQAAVAAYPELGCGAGRVDVMTTWGISEHVLNCSPAAMAFCRDVVDALVEIFPSRFVHLGGDECPRTQWRSSPAARARAVELGLEGPDALQGWFTAEMAALLAARGRRLVGWDEILDAGALPQGTTVMSWRGEAGGVAAATAGFDVVMCPEEPCYFDHYQSDDEDEPLAFGGCTTIEDVYAYRPVPSALGPEAASHVLGTQFQLWTEYLASPPAVEYMAFPRAAALAEVAWSGPGGEAADFWARLEQHLPRLDALGVSYRPLGGPHPWQRGGSGPRRRVRGVD